LVDWINARTQQIALFPESGRSVPESETFEIRAVIERTYRIIYRVHDDRIEVMAVIHGVRLLPSLDSEEI
jgi:plasmid stabilization system protein ParE